MVLIADFDFDVASRRSGAARSYQTRHSGRSVFLRRLGCLSVDVRHSDEMSSIDRGMSVQIAATGSICSDLNFVGISQVICPEGCESTTEG